MKKLFSLILAVAMIATMMAMPVMAADVDHTDHSIVIQEPNEGHEYVAYQIFQGDVIDQDGTEILSNVKWGNNIDTAKTYEWGDTNGNGKIDDDETSNQLTVLNALMDSSVNATYYTKYVEKYNKLKADHDADDEATAVVDALAEWNTTAAAKAFAKIVAKYLTGDPAAKADTITTVTIDGEEVTGYVLNPLSDGYYLVTETKAVEGETATDYILRLVENVVMAPKDGTVTPEKKIVEGDSLVDTCDNNIGDVVDFHITGTMPENLSEFETFYYEFVDTMSEGLTFNEDTLKVYTINGDTQKEIESSYYTVDVKYNQDDPETKDVTEKNTVIRVVFEDLKKLTSSEEYTLRSTTKVLVKYSATVNSAAEIGNPGNPNKVYIKFDRDPYTDSEPGKTPDDTVYVFTFELDVTKIDGEKQTSLEGVEFVLARERSGHRQYAVLDATTNTVSHWTSWIDEAALDKYLAEQVTAGNLTEEDKADKKNELMAEYGVASVLKTDADGKFLVKGLDADLYWLVETKALPGYDMVDDIKFTIAASYGEDKVTELKIIIDNEPKSGDTESGIVATTVVNNPGSELPSTGGMGTTLFYIFGGIMAIGAAVLLITKKRMAA